MMNAIVARMLGEADFHSPEERAQLQAGAHGEADKGNPEEAREVKIAKEILAACKQVGYNLDSVRRKPLDRIAQLANELITMHQASQNVTEPKKMSMMALPQSSSAPSSP